MRPFIRRTTTLAVLGAVAIASGMPAAAQSGSAESITHRQSILTELSPTGEPGASRVFTQVAATGEGTVTVELPGQSTEGLRSLDGFGGPDVDGDRVVHTLEPSGDDADRARTVADNTAELPVSVSVSYRLNGEEIDPGDLAGQDGSVEVEYTVRNLTAEPQDVVSFDAENNRIVETMDIAVPMVGTLSLTLPPEFANIDAPGAVTAGDGRGNTVVNFSLLLFEPLGSEEQVVSWTADAVDTTIPDTSIQVLPVDDQSFGSLNATADAYKGATESLTTLANGALIINSNLLLLASGAGDLLDGLGQLSDGADQLSDGLVNRAAPGARELADGLANRAAPGARELADGLVNRAAPGSRALADGLSQARAGGGELASGLGDLASGASRLSDGLGSARAGGGQLSAGLGDLAAGATRLSDGLGSARAGSGQLAAGLPALQSGAGQLRDGITGVAGAVGGPNDGAADGTVIGGVNALRAGIASLPEGVRVGIQENLEATLLNIVLPQLQTNLEAGLRAQLAANIPAGMEPALEAALLDALQNQFAPALLAQVGPALEAGLRTALQQQLRPGLQAQLEPQLATGLTGALEGQFAPQMQAGLAQALAGQLQAPPTSLDPATATTVADGFAAAFVAGLVDGGSFATFGDQFADGFVTALAPALDAAFAQFAEQFAAGYVEALPGSLGPGLQQFAETFAPLFAAGFGEGFAGAFAPAFAEGFADQVGPSFSTLADQFSTGFADGLGDTLAEEALPGFDRLLAGLNNPACNTADPRNPSNPCGLRQVLGLLRGGSVELANGAGIAATGAATLAAGLRQLDDGGEQLAAGAQTAAAGSGSLVAGLAQLDDGGEQLAAGASRAAAGSGSLAAGLVQLDEGATQLASGLGDAADGSTQLADGLVDAADGSTQLADGLGDAADGSTQLADGLGQAEDGGGRLADGTVALQEGFENQLIGGVSAGRQGASQDYEQVRAVIARGREGAAPYGVAVGADQASTVFQFDLAGVGNEDGPGAGLLAGLAILALAAVGGLGFALRRTMA